MIWPVLIAATFAQKPTATQTRIAAHNASPGILELIQQQPAASGFDHLTAVSRNASYGHTGLVYGHRAGVRTQDPIGVVRLDPTGQARLMTTWPAPLSSVDGPFLDPRTLVEQLPAGLSTAEVGPVRWWRLGLRHVAARAVWLDQPFVGLAHPFLLVEATSGQILDRRSDAAHGLSHDPGGAKPPTAYIYPVDPLLTPEIEPVELPESTRYALSSAHLTVYNCIDLGTTYGTNSALGAVDIRQCEWIRPVPPDGGQWLFEPEPYPLDTALDEDAFAGPHLLWHGEDTLTDLVELGLPLADRPPVWQRLSVQTNRRTADLFDQVVMSDPDAPLIPYDNAFFRRGRERSDGSYTHPELVFGQGTVGDFAYDLDVIIHELGHFAVWTQSGPSSARSSIYGSTAEPGALNEGLADYFAAVRTQDPEIGTYSGDILGRPYIRTLDGSAQCPDAIFGQVHADSQPFSQALWRVRSSLSEADQTRLDQSVIDALPLIGTDGGFAQAAWAITEEARLQVSEAAALALAEEFTRRAVDQCEPFIPVENEAEARSFTQIPAFYADMYERPIPGYLQFVVPDDGPIDLTIQFEQRKSLDVDLWGINEPADIEILGRSGSAIIHEPFYDDSLERYVWSNDGALLGTARRVEELGTTIDGREIEYLYEATVTLAGNGPHYIQLANLAERTVTMRNIHLSWQAADVDTDTGDAERTSSAQPTDKSGCSCSTRGQRTPWSALFLPLVLVVARRRDHP